MWAASERRKLLGQTTELIQSENNQSLFRAASIWKRATKSRLNRPDSQVSASRLRRSPFDNGYDELAITGRHTAAIASLPNIHKDPFDRILVAQAQVEDITLHTNDRIVASYPHGTAVAKGPCPSG